MPRMGAEMSIETMKRALQLVEVADELALDCAVFGNDVSEERALIARCKIAFLEAIAAAEKQEPVAWVQDVEFEQLPEFAFSWVKTRLHDKPLYTHPPKREWVGLTEDEAAECWNFRRSRHGKNIEAKLREKNGC